MSRVQEGIGNPRAKPQRKTRLPEMRLEETRKTPKRNRLPCRQWNITLAHSERC